MQKIIGFQNVMPLQVQLCARYTAEALRAHPSLLLIAPSAALVAVAVNAALLYPPLITAYRHGGYGGAVR